MCQLRTIDGWLRYCLKIQLIPYRLGVGNNIVVKVIESHSVVLKIVF